MSYAGNSRFRSSNSSKQTRDSGVLLVLVRHLLGVLPLLLLLAAAAHHFCLVRYQHLSPWLGAGFGMFATTDTDVGRRVYLYITLENGLEHLLELGDNYQDILERVRGLPSDARLTRVAADAFQAVGNASGQALAGQPVSLRIEVWRNQYQAETLKPRSVPVVVRAFPWPTNGV